jgi:hypothetical protein
MPYEELFAAAGVAFASAPRERASPAAKVKMSDGRLLVDSVIRVPVAAPGELRSQWLGRDA